MIDYFKLDNKLNLANLNKRVEVVKPVDKYFSVDDKINPILSGIYEELYNRSFQVKGLDIEFVYHVDDKDESSNYIGVNSIKHEDFRLNISNGDMVTVMYPERELHFYSDSSSTTLYTYVGDNWEEDKNKFFYGAKVNSKLRGLERIYLQYKTGSYGRGNFTSDTDLDREYSPEGNEPIEISREAEINKLKNFLQSLLENLQSLPKSEFDHSVFDYEKTLLPEPLKLKCFYSTYDYEFDSIKGGNRLISLGNKAEGPLGREIYTSGFVYGEIPNDQIKPTVSSRFVSSGTKYEIDVEILYLDSVYVLDLEPSENLIESFQSVSKFNIFGENHVVSEEEQNKIERKRRDDYNDALIFKMIKIEDYDGSYKKPLYLINRIIRKDEIKSIKECQKKKSPRLSKKALNELLDI